MPDAGLASILTDAILNAAKPARPALYPQNNSELFIRHGVLMTV
jgi:hypothetical protein